MPGAYETSIHTIDNQGILQIMKSKSALNRHYREAAIFKFRMLFLLFIMLLLASVLIGRLVYLQVVKHKFYSTLSQQNLLSILKLEPSRGLIYDRNGVLIAKNLPSYSLMLIPEKVSNFDEAITQLKKILPLTNEEVKKYHRYRYQYRTFDPIPLKTKLTEEQIAAFYVNQQHFPGFLIQTSNMRSYPLASDMSDVLGYMGNVNQEELQHLDPKTYDASDDIGKSGLEKFYENTLHGKIGYEEAEINATGHIVRILKRISPVAGSNLYLTIDSELQKKAHNALGKENGSIVAINPQNGEVLALVSHPSFDPNLFAKGISQKDYNALLDNPNHPLFNRAIQGQFAGGSTVKPFISLMSLANDFVTPTTKIYDTGWFRLPKTKHIYHDWKRTGHGWINITQAIEQSCDTYFYRLATQLGITRLNDYLKQFGFGQKTKIDFPGEQDGLVPSPNWKQRALQTPWYTGDTIESAIGQGFFLVTPLQLANATAMLANRGQHYQPHLLLKTIDENNQSQKITPTTEQPITIQHDWAWDIVYHAMQLVVDGISGTALHFGKHPHYSVAAKTGTAQIYGHTRYEDIVQTNIPKHLRNNHLFIAFAPVKHPKIALAIVIEHSAMADKIAGKLIRFYLTKKGK